MDEVEVGQESMSAEQDMDQAFEKMREQLELDDNGDAFGTETRGAGEAELEGTEGTVEPDGDEGNGEPVEESKSEKPSKEAAPEAEVAQSADDSDDDFPFSWKNEDKDAWKKADPSLRAVVKRREAELKKLVDAKVSEANGVYSKFAGLDKELAPLVQEWRSEQRPLNFEQGIMRAVAFWDHFQKADKKDFVKDLANRLQMKAEDFVETPESEKDVEIRDLRSRLEKIENGKQESEQAQVRSQTQEFQNQLSEGFAAFRKSRNVLGEVKYPQAEIPGVAAYMASLIPQLIQRVPGKSMHDYMLEAYKQAGGQIHSGQGGRSTNQNTESLKAAARSGYSKGVVPQNSASYDSYDAAMQAAAEKLGYFD